MMEEAEIRARQQARRNKSADERQLAAIEDIADSLADIKSELMQIRIALTQEDPIEISPTQPFRR